MVRNEHRPVLPGLVSRVESQTVRFSPGKERNDGTGVRTTTYQGALTRMACHGRSIAKEVGVARDTVAKYAGGRIALSRTGALRIAAVEARSVQGDGGRVAAGGPVHAPQAAAHRQARVRQTRVGEGLRGSRIRRCGGT